MQEPIFEQYIFPNDTISACYLNTSIGAPCEQGSISVVGVDARTVEDVQAAVTFAASHNLRLVVKSTGHDFFGRSTARGSFLVWMHNFKNITFHNSFRALGAPITEIYENAITLGAGVEWQEAHDAVNTRGRVLVGGVSIASSVGAAGGWLLGGGHSPLSPHYGLGVDNVLEFDMVTSAGVYLTANAYQDPDLFWALRGGGGGTYGIVTSVTYRTHPSLPLIGAFFTASVNSVQPTPALQALFAEYVRITANLSDVGWSGRASVFTDVATGSLVMSLTYTNLNASWAQANASIEPFFTFAQNLASSTNNSDSLIVRSAFTAPFDSFFSWYTQIAAGIPPVSGVSGSLGSWLLPRDVIANDYKAVAKTLISFIPAELSYSQIAGGAVSHVDPDSTGLNPAWRKALVHAIFSTGWPEGTPAAVIHEVEASMKQNMTNLRALAPESGAYFNEASLFEPNPAYAFFGDHYDRLKSIKKHYDPLDMFVVTEGVGSDDWDAQLVCRR
ncbi:putative oxidoreductase ORF5 in fasciation locus [Grifola frondosa]|uniref:Putative oxidoreductase ORF5 in fasciation locus n=1 Tax=Grifola frondosa TaxID=5627 RepID=A0A1C7MS71_GRIFR|nr:putative oxidoreductase ORF5 in fasciation locus [Grifola frondosa]